MQSQARQKLVLIQAQEGAASHEGAFLCVSPGGGDIHSFDPIGRASHQACSSEALPNSLSQQCLPVLACPPTPPASSSPEPEHPSEPIDQDPGHSHDRHPTQQLHGHQPAAQKQCQRQHRSQQPDAPESQRSVRADPQKPTVLEPCQPDPRNKNGSKPAVGKL